MFRFRAAAAVRGWPREQPTIDEKLRTTMTHPLRLDASFPRCNQSGVCISFHRHPAAEHQENRELSTGLRVVSSV